MKDSLLNDEAAKLAVEEIGPRVYQLVSDKGDVVIFIVGCQGSGNKFQKEVAQLMNELAVKEGRPALIIFCGDNVYDYGAQSPSDVNFENYFYKMYADETFSGIYPVPCFLCLGNHDANRHKKAYYQPWLLKGKAVEINQQAHSYLPDDRYKSVDEKKTLYSQPIISLSDLPKWNMPYAFYSLVICGVQFFFLNTNTYAKDFLDSKLGIKSGEINQAEWVEKCYHASKENKKIFIQHNPLLSTGKRAFAYGYDTTQYLNVDQISRLQKILNTDTESYSELLCKIFDAQQLKPDVVFAAHDHALSYFNNIQEASERKMCQVITGGGGGDLQRRKEFDENFWYLRNYGFVKMNYNQQCPNILNFDFYTTVGHHLKFIDQSHRAVMEPISDGDINMLRQMVLEVCDMYLDKSHYLQQQHDEHPKKVDSYNDTLFGYLSNFVPDLSSFKNYIFADHSKDDIDIIHDMVAYFNQPILPEKNIILSDLKNMLGFLKEQKMFIEYLKNKLIAYFSETHDIIKSLDFSDLRLPVLG